MTVTIDFDAIREDGAVLHTITRRGKRISGVAKVFATIEVDGVRYSAERQVRLSFAAHKPEGEAQ